MKVIIAGGGTGGHLFPAVALGEELKRQRPDSDVLHVGTSNGLEASWLPTSGLKYKLFPVRGLRGKGPLTRLRAIGEFFAAIRRAYALRKSFGADLVVSAGGYASAPMAVAAIISRIPLVLMEQNTRPGLSNRMLWRFARKVCVGFADTATFFDASRVVITGNPVRLRFIPGYRLKTSVPLQILVLGGSSGAHRLNLGVLNALKILGKTVIKLNVLHQTGEADVGLVTDGYRSFDGEAKVVPFIEDMANVLDSADLIVARSGAMTVSEIALAGRAAIFVPYPFHRDKQQELNAHVIERLGGAVIVNDDDSLGENLAAELRKLLSEPPRLIEMGRRANEAAKPDAAARIAQVCFEIVDSEKQAA
ncbi:MAG: undecaprenyldiphospho-muramoylpentapeptide beta-N-acetylglucosaminyltransferase [Deltaproteobacteria bacterium]|nr:undecaprenyldiphospho-muramoylpentapeptide beta-N-acetylglucosaminyltransferase [Deltaproteobacteria bacterium]